MQQTTKKRTTLNGKEGKQQTKSNIKNGTMTKLKQEIQTNPKQKNIKQKLTKTNNTYKENNTNTKTCKRTCKRQKTQRRNIQQTYKN